ncbi:MAG: SDR family oxidoreductase [Desulfovibrionaceae bacterium]
MQQINTLDKFRIDGRVAIITGGAGLLGRKHAEAIAEAGGFPVLWDVDLARARDTLGALPGAGSAQQVDITDEASVAQGLKKALEAQGRVDILVNNAARDPKVAADGKVNASRLEHFPRSEWDIDLAVGLTGAFLCAKHLGAYMAGNGGGVILNIASDLGVIAPDQRIYRKEGLEDALQPAKPVTYSVVKHGLVGLTKYLATYWAGKNVRCNALSPGGVFNGQPDDFVSRLTNLIPMGRMAAADEYKAAVLFLTSDASSYMTGANLSMDGGRTCW